MLIICSIASSLLGALVSGYVVKNNYAKSVALLNELQARAQDGTDQAKAVIMAKLKSITK